MNLAQALALSAIFVAAGAVKGVTGMGLPTVAVSLLGLWMAPAQAAALLVVPSLATNIAQCRGPHWRRIAAILWPVWVGLTLTTVLVPGLDSARLPIDARTVLGGVLVCYGMWGLWRPALPRVEARAGWAGAVIGAATGLLAGITAIFAIPMVPFMQAMRFEPDEMIQALGLSFAIATLALALRLASTAGPPLLSVQTVATTAGAFAGLWLGARVRAKISAAAFQRALFIVFIGLGVANLGLSA